MNFMMPMKKKVQQLKKERMSIKWLSQTKRLLTSDGNLIWQELTHQIDIETLVSWPTLMLVKLLRLKEFYIIRVKATRLVKFMMALQQWIGWSRNKKEVSQLLQQPQLVSGKIIELILSTHLVT